MTDIVERLRIFPHTTQGGHDLRHEAADEIERLRTENAELKTRLADWKENAIQWAKDNKRVAP